MAAAPRAVQALRVARPAQVAGSRGAELVAALVAPGRSAQAAGGAVSLALAVAPAHAVGRWAEHAVGLAAAAPPGLA